MTSRGLYLQSQSTDDSGPNHRGRSLRLASPAQGFALIEVLAVVLVILIAAAMLLAIAPYERRTAMANRDLTNLRQMGAWTANYANDFEDLHPSFTAAVNTTYADIRSLLNGTNIRRAAGQAIDIIRRRSGRHNFPIPGNWIAYPRYNQLVLADYADRQLPDTYLISTGDKHRMNWIDDPKNKHDQGYWQPFQNPASGSVSPTNWRWPYSSSYETPSAFWDRDPTPGRISQGTHNSYSTSGDDWGPLPLSNVTFPSQKALQYATGSWYASRVPQYFLAESSSVTVLAADGAASLRRTSNTNKGWRPTAPASADHSIIAYNPKEWEPPKLDPSNPSERVIGHYRWTRGRLDGRDFDGPEIDTGQK